MTHERDRSAAESPGQKLLQLTDRLCEPLTFEEVARIIVDQASEAATASSAALWTVDDPAAHATLVRAVGYEAGVEGRFARIPVQAWLPLGDAILRREAIFIESRSEYRKRYPVSEARSQDLAEFQEISYACLPLVVQGRAIAGMSLAYKRSHVFEPGERAFLTVFGRHAAQALERARLFEREKLARERLQSVLEHMPVGVVVAEAREAGPPFVNDAVGRIWRTGDVAAEAADRYSAFRAFHPDGRPVVHEDWPGVRALRGEYIPHEEFRIERKDGSDGWVQITSAPIRSGGGDVEMAVSTVVDVTAEKVARAKAEEASRAKDEFLAMLGHELRNPLAPIVTALHLMKLRGSGELERERAVIQRQVNHLMRLVDDLLDVSRAMRGSLPLVRTPIELAPIVGAAIEVASPLLEERRHSLTVSVPANDLVIEADAQRLTQVVANLLSNAAKYTPPGGQVTVSARREGGDVVLEVVDDGIGIAPDLLTRVFDAFTQGRRALDRKEGGLGLGLAIARQLIVAHGGEIEAHSAGEGCGTRITVKLPRGSQRAVDRQSPIAHSGPRARRRVLVVDDNPDAAELLREALRDAGHEVRTAPDGPTALQMVEGFAPDIAFLDIGLPVMDGYELAGQLRSLHRLARTPLVAVTGYAQMQDRERALSHGFVEHLAKPLDPERVLECIERLPPAAVISAPAQESIKR